MVKEIADYSALSYLPPSDWATYLDERSGLPGPRANLTLVTEVASVAQDDVIDPLLEDGREFPVICAAAAIGRRADQPGFLERARSFASDERWRVQEGVIIGLQLLGDDAPVEFKGIVEAWTSNPDPYVKRVAVAAICEPRLLNHPDLPTAAIRACDSATQFITGLPQEQRKLEAVRKLRKALGYCWSVAMVGNPQIGLPAFRALDTGDSDVAWIVKQNLSKKRLRGLL